MPRSPEDDESFLNRWSKRKRAAVAEPEAPPPLPEPDTEPQASEITDEELAALPAIDDLTFGTDIRPFLRKGVPHTLRNAALRKMWLLTPAIRDHADPAVDYAWDWNTPGGVPGDGAAPSPARAAQMLRDLMNPRPTPDAEATVSTDPDSPLAPGKSSEKVSPAKPESAPEVGIENAASKNIKSVENQEDEGQSSPRRRHGGALPS